jgi:hypothetical protein
VNAAWERYRIADRLRALLYPLIPVIAVATIWVVGWARSIESRMAVECGALRVDADGIVVSTKAASARHLQAESDEPSVASDDQQN